MSAQSSPWRIHSAATTGDSVAPAAPPVHVRAPYPKGHVPALDGVRGIAILLVLVHNLSTIVARDTLIEKAWTAVVEAGWTGVQLFFVLSGFLITRILLEDQNDEDGVRKFYVRRMLRIFPLYYLFLVAYFIVLPLIHPASRKPFGEAVWYWLYLSNWSKLVYGTIPGVGHLWSLAVEEQFYLVWPWVVRRMRSPLFAGVCVAIIIVSALSRFVMVWLDASPDWLYSSTIARMGAPAFGALLALGFHHESWRARIERALFPTTIVIGVMFAAMLARSHGLNRNNVVVELWGHTLVSIASVVLVARAALPSPPRLLTARPLTTLGKYSYALYIFHNPLKQLALASVGATLVAQATVRPIFTDIAFTLIVSASACVFARLSWRWVERPALRLKDRWAARTVRARS